MTSGKPIPPQIPISDDHEQRLVGVAEKALAGQPERVEDGVGDPEALVEDEREQHPLGGDRGDERSQERGPVDADQPDPAVQRHRQEEPEPGRDRHEEDRVDDRVLDRVAERRVAEQRVVIREPHPLRRRDQVGGVEREQQRPADRDDREADDDHDRGEDERPGGRVLSQNPLGERPPRCGRLGAHPMHSLRARAPGARCSRCRPPGSAPRSDRPPRREPRRPPCPSPGRSAGTRGSSPGSGPGRCSR